MSSASIVRAAVLLAAFALLLTTSMAAAWESVEPAPIAPGAKSLGEGRYIAQNNFTDTLDHYKRFFKTRGGVRWRTIIHQPNIKAKYLENLRKRSSWAGINIYERNGEVRLFVVPASVRSRQGQSGTPTPPAGSQPEPQ